ncbi:MAG: hypothetical protein EXR27_06280 [Betaproteobacteria bacterium]|nr:hypothetical protein [Betaproteobacteria bacterium]
MTNDSRFCCGQHGRRVFLSRALAGGAAASAGLLLPLMAAAQSGQQVRNLRGSVRINGQPATQASAVRPGDLVSTGGDGYIEFVAGRDAFMLRSMGEMRLEPGTTGGLVGGLRLLTGALAGVFNSGTPRSIYAPNVTIGIRGTGIYLEARAEATYACACYGAVQLVSTANSRDRSLVEGQRHHAHLVLNQPRDGSRLVTAPQENHTDEDMDRLEQLVGRRAPLGQAR